MNRYRSLMIAAPLVAAAATLGGCVSDGYGYGGGVGYASSFGDPYWGWYGDYYYPGTGFYVYDSHRRRVRWNDDQQRYWQGRNQGWRGDRGHMRNNWHDFRRPQGGRPGHH